MKKLIAVYGTLKEGHHNHRVLGESKLIGKHVTEPKFTMYSNGGFPIVSPYGDTPIVIEVYQVDNPTDLQRVYRLEGYSGTRNSSANWYDTVDVETPYGVAEMFVMDKVQGRPVVASGEW